MIIQARRCLVVPDVHQDIAWVERILAREIEADLVVFLGDYFDSRRPPDAHAGVAATCAFLDELRAKLGERVIFLLGNHDVQYLEARASCLRHQTPRNMRYRCGDAFSHSAAKRIAKTLTLEFWAAARLFVYVNGWLLCHAGLAPALWPLGETPDASLATLGTSCAAALKSITAPHTPPHPLLRAGTVRGGDAVVGGITWLDWNDEFEDSVPLPQLVGHTVNPLGARRAGRSWCLDGGQTCYGVLTPNQLHVHRA